MFKRYSIGALVIIVLVLGVVGTVLARSNNTSPKDDFCPHEEQACGDVDTPGDGHHGMMHDILADALGMTDQELSAAMSDGQTIADLAAAQGVELDDLWLEMPHAEHMKDLGTDHAGCGMMEGCAQSGHLHHQDGHCSDSFTPTQPGE